MATEDIKNSGGWAAEYRRLSENEQGLMTPNETLVRLLRGPYLPMPRPLTGLRVLDVGCGNGNNTLFLARLGMEAYGTEIHQDICDSLEEKAKRSGLSVSARIGTNTALPFEDNYFDILVSWNVLHYESEESGIQAGIAEYARVLKPGGRLLLSTTGPEHKILRGAKTVAAHTYEIARDDDFRKGERFFYFDAPNYIHYYFGRSFADVQVGRTHDHLFTETLDWWIVTGVKP